MLKHILSTLAFLTLAACGTAPGDQTSEAKAAVQSEILPGTFKMDQEAGKKPSSCDVHVELKIAGGFTGTTVTLANKVDGNCEIFIKPNERAYVLTEEQPSCGSRRFTGKIDGKTIELVDHRTRICKDIVPAKIVVAETQKAGNVVTLYSRDH